MDFSSIAGYLPRPSQITDHEALCCSSARAWFRAVDRSCSFSGGAWHPPTWLRERYSWGPICWPLAWCEIVEMKALDCGALAALATHVWGERGRAVIPMQLALRYPRKVAAGWRAMWVRQGQSGAWVDGGLCYHEACGVVQDGKVEVWDPTESRWLEPSFAANAGFGAVIALKACAEEKIVGPTLRWHSVEVRCGRWTRVGVCDTPQMAFRGRRMRSPDVAEQV